jgi:hypothetical protein
VEMQAEGAWLPTAVRPSVGIVMRAIRQMPAYASAMLLLRCGEEAGKEGGGVPRVGGGGGVLPPALAAWSSVAVLGKE